MGRLSHVDEHCHPSMVDVSDKRIVSRCASASGYIHLQSDTLRLIEEDKIAKGSVLVTAELAGIQAAKETARLIPLCHPLMLSSIQVKAVVETTGVRIASEVKCADRTGVEMEALTAVSVALLTIYDMCKAVDTNMRITDICLIEKTKQEIAQ